MNIDILVSVLSWEERYLLGLQRNLSEYNPAKIILFHYKNPLTADWKKDNLKKTRKILGDKLVEFEIDGSNPNENWSIFYNAFNKYCKDKTVLLDITTMTRESIWLSLYNCKLNGCRASYIYYRPKEYSTSWLTRDPGKPRLLYKMSGIAKLGRSTLLIATEGFDVERLDNLIFNFEPRETIVFVHDGKDQRNKDNKALCESLLDSKYHIKRLFEYDAYNVEKSTAMIINKLKGKDGSGNVFLSNYNVILNSLGPKTSAISLFKVWIKYPHFALSYIPSKEYNREYSHGIGESFSGEIPF